MIHREGKARKKRYQDAGTPFCPITMGTDDAADQGVADLILYLDITNHSPSNILEQGQQDHEETRTR